MTEPCRCIHYESEDGQPYSPCVCGHAPEDHAEKWPACSGEVADD
jgi:hypothetical protein